MRDIEPYKDFNKNFLQNFFEDDFFPTFSKFRSLSMKTDIKENDKEYILTAEMPGFNKKDISVEINHNVLTIKGKRDEQYNENKEGYVRQERNYGSFKRTFRLDNIKESDISGSYENGVLRLSLPKKTSAKNTNRRIDIN